LAAGMQAGGTFTFCLVFWNEHPNDGRHWDTGTLKLARLHR
jgi:hypothetical protein